MPGRNNTISSARQPRILRSFSTVNNVAAIVFLFLERYHHSISSGDQRADEENQCKAAVGHPVFPDNQGKTKQDHGTETCQQGSNGSTKDAGKLFAPETDAESGKGAEEIAYKYVTKEIVTADPASTKSSVSLINEGYENGTLISTDKQNKKVYTEGGKNYIYSSISDGETTAENYSTLSSYGVNAEKEAMLL